MRIFSTNCLSAALPVFSLPAFGLDYFVATDGSDDNAGTIAEPFATLMAAQAAAEAGDTVYIRGGTYPLTDDNISSYTSVRAIVNDISKDGISYIAWPGEHPIFDFSQVRPENYRVVGFLVSADDWVSEGFDIVGIQITISDTRTQSTAIRVDKGNGNRFERLAIHDGMGIGWYLASGSNNQVINVDAYNNKGLNSNSHGNIDGFGVHPNLTSGTGNIIRGSRAWFNSDDGFDFISASAVVVVENSWAFYNGYDTDFTPLADGNGFKAGGYGSDGDEYPIPVPVHEVRRSLAVGNKAAGFYANHHVGGQLWIHNSALNNRSSNFNMLSTLEDNDTDVPGYNHVMRNNLGFGSNSEIINLGLDSENDLYSNYFNLPVTIDSTDFLSLDESQLMRPRKPNGDLPDITFAHLSPDSDLVDSGADFGEDFEGSAPDLGAFESEEAATHLRVHSIATTIKQHGKKIYAEATVSIQDNTGKPESDVDVKGVWERKKNHREETVRARTNDQGIAVLTAKKKISKKDTLKFCVTDLKGSLPFESDDSDKLCQDVTSQR